MTDAELRELDAEIHREVMGLGEACACGQGVNVYDPDTGRCRRCGNLTCGGYSRDIRAAWLVVEKLGARYLFSVTGPTGDGTWHVSIYYGPDGCGAAGETAPAAICRAALAAVRGRDAGGGT